MTPRVIVSYDDTAEDRDALALGRLLAKGGAEISLAYVRHVPESLGEDEAEALLERGAQELGSDVPRHVVVSASTGDGLIALAEREHADVVVFGSDYRTPPGRVQPGTSAQRLLEGGPAAVAIAPANLRDTMANVTRVGVLPQGADESADLTARALADSLRATVASSPDEPVDLLVVGSRPEAPEGRVMVSAAAEYAIENATQAVLVVQRGVSIPFAPLTPAAA
jgi:nucleotide-binding universal stress UspA family protein